MNSSYVSVADGMGLSQCFFRLPDAAAAAAVCPLLQLLGGILDVNSSYVSVVDELGLSQCFFDFLTLDHPNNNVHNIRLCRQLALSGCISTQQLLQLRAADKVGGGGARK